MLEFADVTVNESTGTVTLRALVANPRQELLPGMFVRALLDKGQRKDALLVPQAGVSRDLKGGAQVMLVNGESTVELRKVVTSQVIDGKALIESGLAAGDRVIVAGLQKVRPGAPVKIADPAAAGKAAGQPGGQAGPKADAAK
jgi:membrane fusion protein (multidrug efflux system)